MAFLSLLVWAVSSPAMAFVYYGILNLPRGCIRLLAALPLITFYVAMAPQFDTVFERGTYSFFFIWLTSFKVVLLCWDHGPAADPWAVASFPRFLAVMTLSLQIKRQRFGERSSSKKLRALVAPAAGSLGATSPVVAVRDRESRSATRRTTGHGSLVPRSSRLNGGTSSVSSPDSTKQRSRLLVLLKHVDESQEMHTVVFRLLFKLVCMVTMTYASAYRGFLALWLLILMYSFYLYITCSLIFEGIAAVVSPLMGIELEPFFDKPFLAHSLADFWGQRWNLLVSNLLRVAIYDPLLRWLLCWSPGERGSSSGAAPRPSRSPGLASGSTALGTKSVGPPLHGPLPLWARSIAMFSCFLVSGLMHELIFHFLTQRPPTWEVTIFFTTNGAATLIEGVLRRKTTWRLPRLISTLLTISFVLVTAIWFFFPPLIRSGTADRAIGEFQYFFQTVSKMVRAL